MKTQFNEAGSAGDAQSRRWLVAGKIRLFFSRITRSLAEIKDQDVIYCVMFGQNIEYLSRFVAEGDKRSLKSVGYSANGKPPESDFFLDNN